MRDEGAEGLEWAWRAPPGGVTPGCPVSFLAASQVLIRV